MKTLFVGNSHLKAIEDAASDANKKMGASQLEFLQLRNPQFRPFITDEKHPKLCAPVRDAILKKTLGKDFIVSVVQGAEHHKMGLSNHERKFDFVTQSECSVELGDNTMLIPRQFVEYRLNQLLNLMRISLSEMRSIVPKNITLYHLESPAPIPLNEYIVNNPGPFKQVFETRGVASPRLRQKIWKVHSNMVKRICEENEVIHIPSPFKSMDGEGFLREEYWGVDPVHGNAAFGKLVLDDILKRLGGSEI